MLVDLNGIKHLDSANRRRLSGWGLQRRSSRPTAARAALAKALVAGARRLAPEIAEPTALRPRAAPN